MTPALRWAPAAVLAVGALLATVGVKAQRALPLRVPLVQAVPDTMEGFRGRDLPMSEEEAQAVGVTSYLSRVYGAADSSRGAGFTIYVGYYDRQTQGRTIHSPKNCLPGSGWEPLASRAETISTAAGPAVTVNRYLLQRQQEQALVLYWYQGRGRVAWNEYRVKWDLLRDAALRRRSDEALVRIVVPITSTEEAALQRATEAARILVTSVYAALPS